MSTVSGGARWEREPVLDPLGRRTEFADVFQATAPSAVTLELVDEVRRGRIDLARVAQLFAPKAYELVPSVRALDRDGLRATYRLLFVEAAALARAVRELLVGFTGQPVKVHVADAVGEVIGAATRLESLAEAWMWFIYGDKGL